jgi:hypothetical protein
VKIRKRSNKLMGFVCLSVAAALAVMVAASNSAIAQEKGDGDDKLNNNAPPFDFNDAFYTANGINVQQLNTPAAGRFGLFRKTGPPAGNNQVNWVIDNSNTDPDRNNVRILASTGGYKDDTGSPTQFISIIAFLTSQDFFTGASNARGITMEQIAGVPNNNAPGSSAFEAYAGLKQIGPGGVFLPAPCALIGILMEYLARIVFRWQAWKLHTCGRIGALPPIVTPSTAALRLVTLAIIFSECGLLPTIGTPQPDLVRRKLPIVRPRCNSWPGATALAWMVHRSLRPELSYIFSRTTWGATRAMNFRRRRAPLARRKATSMRLAATEDPSGSFAPPFRTPRREELLQTPLLTRFADRTPSR